MSQVKDDKAHPFFIDITQPQGMIVTSLSMSLVCMVGLILITSSSWFRKNPAVLQEQALACIAVRGVSHSLWLIISSHSISSKVLNL